MLTLIHTPKRISISFVVWVGYPPIARWEVCNQKLARFLGEIRRNTPANTPSKNTSPANERFFLAPTARMLQGMLRITSLRLQGLPDASA